MASLLSLIYWLDLLFWATTVQCVKIPKWDLERAAQSFRSGVKGTNPRVMLTHQGSAASMEGAAGLWNMSVRMCSFRYKAQVYDFPVPTEREECVNHISKRMFAAPTKFVEQHKGSGGTGKLTQVRMKKWGSFYRNAITQKDTVPEMQAAIFAILMHSSSTDETPLHQRCPVGENSWCFYQKAVANNTSTRAPSSHQPVPKEILE